MSRRYEDGGMVAVFTVLVVTFVAMPLLALVVDLGIARTATGRAGTAADSAALAAAVKLSANPADQVGAAAAARQFVQDNFGVDPSAWASCLDPHPLPAGTPATPDDCVSIDVNTRQVRVTVPAQVVPSVFAGVLGKAPPAASATSTAQWGALAPLCALCVLDTAGTPGTFAGGADRTTVVAGDIAVAGPILIGTGGSLTADNDRLITYGASSTGNVTPSPLPGPHPVDPLATELSAVAAASASLPQGSTVAGKCMPGIYSTTTFTACTGGFSGDGIYVLTGDPRSTIRTTGILASSMTNAVIYVTCAKPSSAATPVQPQTCSTTGTTPKPRLTTSGSPVLGGSTTYSGLALAFDPSTTATQRLASSGTLQVDGSIDGPATTFRDPVSCNGRLVVNGRLVAGGVQFTSCGSGAPVLTVTMPAAATAPAGVRLVPSTP